MCDCVSVSLCRCAPACSESLCGPSSGSHKYCTPIFRFTKSTQHRRHVCSTVPLWFAVLQARHTLLGQLTSRLGLGRSQQIEVERMSRCVEAEGIYAQASLVCTSFRPISRTHNELVLHTRTAMTKLLLQTAQALAVLTLGSPCQKLCPRFHSPSISMNSSDWNATRMKHQSRTRYSP